MRRDLPSPYALPCKIIAVCTALLCGTGQALADAPEQASDANIANEAEGPSAWLPGTNRWGSRGMLRVDAAHGIRPKALIFNFSAEVGTASAFFEPADRETYNINRLGLVWSPLRHLEIGLSEAWVVESWQTFVKSTLQIIGLPQLHVKYTRPVAPAWAVGGIFGWTVPTSVASAWLVPKASVLTLQALGSYHPWAAVEFALNAGVVLDYSHNLAGADITPDQRFVYQVEGATAGALLGIGALGQIHLHNVVGLAPFAEVTARLSHASPFGDNPMRATVGVKGYLVNNRLVELALGADARLGGAPRANAAVVGVLPWSVFALVSLHLFDQPPTQVQAGMACDSDTDCPSDQRCLRGRCAYTMEVVKEVNRVEKVAQQLFVIAGTVMDKQLRRPVQDAKVTFDGFEQTPLGVDPKTGKFRSFPLACGPTPVGLRVEAPNYQPVHMALMRGAANQEVPIAIDMVPAEHPDAGTLSGSVKDAHTGKPIRGARVFVITLQQTLAVDSRGAFSGVVRAGQHDVLVAAPGYATIRRHVVIHDQDTIAWDLTLSRSKRAHDTDE